MLESGHIMLHRSIVNWEWYDEVKTCKFFLHLLLTVNWQQGKWRGVTIERGQRIASYKILAKETGLSVQTVRTCTKRLVATGEVTYQSTPEYGLYTVVNYNKYQGATHQTTHQQHASNKGVTSDWQLRNKENKENKAKKKRYGEFAHVLLLPEEYEKLHSQYPHSLVEGKLAALDCNIQNGNKKYMAYKDHYAVLGNWCRQDKEKEKAQTTNPFLRVSL